MSNKKISELSSASTPLTGSEIVAINQSSVTDSVSVANLTAGRAVSAASLALTTSPLPATSGGTGLTSFTANGVVYASSSSVLATSSAFTFNGTDVGFTGNLIPGTASKGINFTANTPASGMTSQLLNWYETGTWTPSVGGNATYYAQVGRYTRIGNIVRISGSLVINVLGTGSATSIFGLPFVGNPPGPTDFIGFTNFSGLALSVTYIAGSAGGSQIDIRSLLTAGTGTSINNVLGNGTRVDFAGTYTI